LAFADTPLVSWRDGEKFSGGLPFPDGFVFLVCFLVRVAWGNWRVPSMRSGRTPLCELGAALFSIPSCRKVARLSTSGQAMQHSG